MAKKNKVITPTSNVWDTNDTSSVIVPDEVVYYIVSNYLQIKRTTGVSVVSGVSTQTVEDILQLLVNWGSESGKIKEGVLHLGEES